MTLPILFYPFITLLSIYATTWCNMKGYSAGILFFFTTTLAFIGGLTSTPLSYGLSMITAFAAFVIYDAILVAIRICPNNLMQEEIPDLILPIRPYIHLVYGINALILLALIIKRVFQIDY